MLHIPRPLCFNKLPHSKCSIPQWYCVIVLTVTAASPRVRQAKSLTGADNWVKLSKVKGQQAEVTLFGLFDNSNSDALSFHSDIDPVYHHAQRKKIYSVQITQKCLETICHMWLAVAPRSVGGEEQRKGK